MAIPASPAASERVFRGWEYRRKKSAQQNTADTLVCKKQIQDACTEREQRLRSIKGTPFRFSTARREARGIHFVAADDVLYMLLVTFSMPWLIIVNVIWYVLRSGEQDTPRHPLALAAPSVIA